MAGEVSSEHMCAHFKSPNAEALKRFNPLLLVSSLDTLGLYKTDIWPGKPAPVLANDNDSEAGPVWHLASFGLMPHWAKPTLYRSTYNARTETVATKPSFRSAWRNRQYCAVPVEHFFEPNYESGKAHPWAIGRQDGGLFWLAGLWECFTDGLGQPVRSFTLLTIGAAEHELMSRFHGPEDEKRSVVVLPADGVATWLSAKEDCAARRFFSPFDAREFCGFPA